ncbi:hypothetical protein TREMEDRAFT_71288 [Tremella mesenterica DSM 1558]|uniref:uncharacterized protein n=1 Tax=Tremella mesenterica (strain ATCC 24925 / CBS 8224 / DSM 1558 / NBRC 9311 / NRRL Y-6157 / RJB 2259-6 / UBC 559-6) TaxID=578456 RepID=UPI0003F49B9D|nr:uncharacterized protein TREMEDRAFT_71288 [Tremella mesenterica DSM 1558]EIW70405.1 hypothetical protein TREMEDRAFT_71288 [Tremella mesenterica DSM 1558]
MAIAPIDKSQKIVIIGAGVFGLSTALHLARRGYTDVTVLDRQPFEKNHYAPEDGCDGASADINKKRYQNLAERTLPIWKEWTKAVTDSNPEKLPAGLNPTDEILSMSGFMRTGGGHELSPFHAASLQGIVEAGRRDHVFLLNDEKELERAEALDAAGSGQHWAGKMQRFAKLLGGDVHGILDTDAGYTRADKACLYALHLAKEAGVKFVLDPIGGMFDSFVLEGEGSDKKVVGVKTKDGKVHPASKAIAACGGWTASVVPEASTLLETTGGSVAYVDLPKDRQDLWDKFGDKQFCTWSFQYSEGIGMGGFPRTDNGRLKFGYRATKYTNYKDHPVTGQRLSVPKTKYSEDPITNIPLHALNEIKKNIIEIFPELVEIGITGTRMCWYTDSIDNHFVGDYVPGYNETLFVASGGSGHGFKFLPTLGHHFVNQLEHVADEFTAHWKWRAAAPGEFANGLEEGEAGPRVLSKVKMATEADWKF